MNRQTKGFRSPFIEWTLEEYKEETLNIILEVNSHLNIFNKGFIVFLYNEVKEKRYKQHFWIIFIFSKWFKKAYL